MNIQVGLLVLFFSLVKIKVRSKSHFSGHKKPQIWTVVDCDGYTSTRKPIECTGDEFQDCLRGQEDWSKDDGIMNTLNCIKLPECKHINCIDNDEIPPNITCANKSEKWGPCKEAEDGGGKGGGCFGCEKGDGRGSLKCGEEEECCERCVKVSVRTDTSTSSRVGNEDWSRKLGFTFVFLGFGTHGFI